MSGSGGGGRVGLVGIKCGLTRARVNAPTRPARPALVHPKPLPIFGLRIQPQLSTQFPISVQMAVSASIKSFDLQKIAVYIHLILNNEHSFPPSLAVTRPTKPQDSNTQRTTYGDSPPYRYYGTFRVHN